MEVKERIINGALNQFCQYGVRTVTMDDLAAHIGVSKRTIYENFKDKQVLLMEAVIFYMTNHRALAHQCIDKSENVINGLTELFLFAVEHNSKISPQFFRDIKKYYPEVNEFLCSKNQVRDFGITRLLFNKGIEQGIFRKNLHLELANETLQMLFNIDSDNFRHLPELTPKDFFRDVFFAYLIGLSSSKGREVILQEQERILAMDLPTIRR